MQLSELAKAVNQALEGETILLYGGARVGKSTMAATIAKVKRITLVDWFDLENGQSKLIHLVKTGFLTEEEAAKIRIFRIRDSVELPLAYETMQKVFGLRRPIDICDAHGRDMKLCQECTKAKGTFQTFDMSKHNANTAIVIDSGSQYSDSILHAYNKGDLVKGVDGLDIYRNQGLRLVEALTEIQRGRTNWIMITHEQVVELEAGSERIAAMDFKGPKTEKYYPLIGTKPFSMKVGKYFAHIAYLELKLRKHTGGSATTYRADTVTGSRIDWALENQQNEKKETQLSLVPLFEGKK